MSVNVACLRCCSIDCRYEYIIRIGRSIPSIYEIPPTCLRVRVHFVIVLDLQLLLFRLLLIIVSLFLNAAGDWL